MNKRKLNLICLLALVIRLGVLLGSTWTGSDGIYLSQTAEYVELADSIRSEQQFQRDGGAEIYHTPGYPALLAAIPWIGPSWFAIASMFGILLDVAATALLALLGWLIWNERVGLLAALLHAVNPLAVAVSIRIAPVGPFTAVLVAALLCLVLALRNGSTAILAGGTLLLAAACFIHPVGLLVAGVLLVLLAVRAAVGWRDGRRWLHLTTAGVVLIGSVSLWVARNGRQASYTGFSAAATVHLVKHEAAATLADAGKLPLPEARQVLEDRIQHRLRSVDRNDRDHISRIYRQEGLAIMEKYPGRWALVHLRGSTAALLPGMIEVFAVLGLGPERESLAGRLQQQGPAATLQNWFDAESWLLWTAAPFVLLLVGRYIFAFRALVVGALKGGIRSEHWLLVLTAAVLLLAWGPASEPSTRMPVAPLISLAAAAGLLIRRDRAGAADGA